MQGQSCSATPVIAARRRTSPSFLLPSAAGRAGGGAHFRQPRRSSLKKLRALRHDGGDPVLQPLVELLQRTDTLDDESSMDAAAHAAILTGARSLSTPSLVPRCARDREGSEQRGPPPAAARQHPYSLATLLYTQEWVVGFSVTPTAASFGVPCPVPSTASYA